MVVGEQRHFDPWQELPDGAVHEDQPERNGALPYHVPGINTRDADNCTPLHVAILKGTVRVLRLRQEGEAALAKWADHLYTLSQHTFFSRARLAGCSAASAGRGCLCGADLRGLASTQHGGLHGEPPQIRALCAGCIQHAA